MAYYDNISGFYDEMTGFSNRINNELERYKIFLEKYPVKTALDIGCGTGLHSIVLSKLGIKTAGIDISPEMVERARQNAQDYHQKIDFYQSDMSQVKEITGTTFDAAFCLGNTIPHIMDDKQLLDNFINIHQLLSDGGYFIIQLLNYEKILTEKLSLINEKKVNHILYKRYYTFHSHEKIFFHIEVKDLKSNQIVKKEEIILRPYLKSEVMEILIKAGFSKINLYEEVDFIPFTKESYVVTLHAFS